ncbi:type IV pilin N-terminal domain-containing protein [Halomicrobium sp. LC1Hm]|uniref:type IV pilin N-terminal domain-containing protein n=1 Tax=Halomicrobium sp. LC1Hm TaxID=2610902 RepID=UPI0012984684|nr:type IV pilin N-terminal domain-containing protein [Halomicrobium sp. LC1Hm]QGA83968.1 Pilin/Flagellin, FlaG/FlaF family [Halomicrobium sp. LC1Hm]
MGVRESWNELGTGGKILVGLAVGVVLLAVLLVVLVVLAAVLASFVLGVGGDTAQTAPAASFEFDYDDSTTTTTIRHEAGDSIPASQLRVVVAGQSVGWADGGGAASGDDGDVIDGDSITVDTQPGDRIRVVYEGPDTSSTLAAHEIHEVTVTAS